MKTDDVADLLREARDRFDRAMDYERENRDEALDDLKFLAPSDEAGQWPDAVRQERTAAGRPMLTINRLPQFVAQVANDMKMNRPAVKVSPVDDGSDPKLAEVLTGIVRNVERNSDATRIYSEAGASAAACGMGHWRVTTEYVDDTSFDLDIRVRPIRNPFAVLWDPASTDYCRESAGFCFVYEEMPVEDFKARYPDAKAESWQSGDVEDVATSSWYTRERVRVAEYWLKKPTKRTLVKLATGEVLDKNMLPEEAAPLVVDEREIAGHKVCMYLLTGSEVLEGPVDWPGKHIPIVSVWGRETFVAERLVRQSVIRYAKDPQRVYNYWVTSRAEAIALAPKAPFLATLKQIEGHERFWLRANRDNLPFLPFNPDPLMPGMVPQRQPMPEVPQAMFAEARAAEADIHATTGIYPPALGQKSNESSGKAILARQRESDVGTFDYVDNLARSVAWCGRILIDLIPRIYDGTRIVRILGEDDSVDFVQLRVPNPRAMLGGPEYVTLMRDDKGATVVLPDLSAGRYDVTVSTGPSYSTKRQESAEAIMQFMQASPGAGAAIADLVAKAQDWPGADEIAKRLRRINVMQGLVEPTDEDGPPPPPPPPDPKAVADAERAAADAEYKRAQTEGVHLDNAVKEAELAAMINASVQQAIAATLAAYLGPPQPAQPGPMQPAPGNGGGLFDAPTNGYADPGVASGVPQ